MTKLNRHPNYIAAKESGEKKWFGAMCRKCGADERYTSSRNCVGCTKSFAVEMERAQPGSKNAADRKRYAENPELREKKRVYREENSESIREYQNEYRLADIAAASTRLRLWKQRNPEAWAALQHARRATIVSAEGTFTAADVKHLDKRQAGMCAYCDSPWSHVDHMTPLSRGGSNWPRNLQLLCVHHNTSKGAKTDPEFRSAKGQLPTGKFLCSALNATADI